MSSSKSLPNGIRSNRNGAEHRAHKRKHATTAGGAAVTQTTYSDAGSLAAVKSMASMFSGPQFPHQWTHILSETEAAARAVPPASVITFFVEEQSCCLKGFKSAQEALQRAVATQRKFAESTSTGLTPPAVLNSVKMPYLQLMILSVKGRMDGYETTRPGSFPQPMSFRDKMRLFRLTKVRAKKKRVIRPTSRRRVSRPDWLRGDLRMRLAMSGCSSAARILFKFGTPRTPIRRKTNAAVILTEPMRRTYGRRELRGSIQIKNCGSAVPAGIFRFPQLHYVLDSSLVPQRHRRPLPPPAHRAASRPPPPPLPLNRRLIGDIRGTTVTKGSDPESTFCIGALSSATSSCARIEKQTVIAPNKSTHRHWAIDRIYMLVQV
ncbi:hypothetical protein B0H13DRAFT_2265167 [Mycena leptocephala]|nr:hypothetical protein B0H13DRAFT_2265167 [Mycena leptocephala]